VEVGQLEREGRAAQLMFGDHTDGGDEETTYLT